MTQDVFEKTLIEAADSFFMLPDAVWVDYLPSGGAVRRIRAILDRTGIESIGEAGGDREAFELTVKNSAESGISSAEINTGADKLRLQPREGMAPITASIVDILDHDAAMMRIKAI
jgi:hypothetical protein